MLLDDLQTLDFHVQAKLLQVLDRGTFTHVGCDRILVAACRFVLAMTEDPDVLVKKGLLLKDLRYRFRECHIRIPGLGERREEIPLLAQRALERCPARTKVDGPSRITDAALALLLEAEWEGNVRQLGGVIEYAYLVARAAGGGEIRPEHLPQWLQSTLCYRRRGDREANRLVVERSLRVTGGNVSAAARLVGMSRTTFTRLRKEPAGREALPGR